MSAVWREGKKNHKSRGQEEFRHKKLEQRISPYPFIRFVYIFNKSMRFYRVGPPQKGKGSFSMVYKYRAVLAFWVSSFYTSIIQILIVYSKLKYWTFIPVQSFFSFFSSPWKLVRRSSVKEGGGREKRTQLTYNTEKTKGQSQKQNGWYKEREESKSERKMVTN